MQKPETISEEADSHGLDKLLNDIQLIDTIVSNWDDNYQETFHASRTAHDALNKEAFSRLIRALKMEPAALAILTEAVSDEVVYSVLRHHGIVKATVHERIETALESVRPYLASHGGNVELVEFIPPDTAVIRLLGACDGCPASELTLSEGVEKAIKENCPEITTVTKAKGGVTAMPTGVSVLNFVSPFANKNDEGWVFVCRVGDIPEHEVQVATIDGNELLLSRRGYQVSCFQNACSHLGMPLDMGEVNDGILVCPHHGFRFLLQTGECLTVPEVQLQSHDIRVIGDKVEVKFS